MTRTYNLLSVLVAALALSIATSAAAQHTHSSDVVRVEAHGTLSTYEGIGGGIRGEFVVLPEGALPDVNDDISLTAGGDAIIFFDDDDHDHAGHDHDNEGLGIWAAGAVQWNFYLGQDWSLFPELGIWLQFGEDGHGHGDDDDIDMDLLLGVGGRYHTSARSAILLRIEYPGLLHIGVQF